MTVALPPPSIIFIAVLSVLDLIGAVVIAGGMAFFGLALAESDMGALLFGWSASLFGFVALKLIALVGLLYARRWAVVLGAVAFKIPVLPEWLDSMTVAMIVFVGATVLYLACTLPHWSRMTWRVP
jgi:hypothetical protein